MKEYIFGERTGFTSSICKRRSSVQGREQICAGFAGEGRTVLFVGTRGSADAIAEEAGRCGMFYVNNRWLGDC